MKTRLTVELVPSTCWYTNVRSNVPKAVWDQLRRQVAADAGYRCEICGGRGRRWPVECHEVWDYDDDRKIQRLQRLVALCPACHEVKHAAWHRSGADSSAGRRRRREKPRGAVLTTSTAARGVARCRRPV